MTTTVTQALHSEDSTSAPIRVLLETRVRGVAEKIRDPHRLYRFGELHIALGLLADLRQDGGGPTTWPRLLRRELLSGAQGRFTSPDAPFAGQHPGDPQSWNL